MQFRPLLPRSRGGGRSSRPTVWGLYPPTLVRNHTPPRCGSSRVPMATSDMGVTTTAYLIVATATSDSESYWVLIVMVAIPTVSPAVTASVLNVLFSSPAASADILTVVPVSTAVPSGLVCRGCRVLPSRPKMSPARRSDHESSRAARPPVPAVVMDICAGRRQPFRALPHRVFDGAGSDPRRTGAVQSGSVGNYTRGACSACTHRTHLYLEVAGLEVMVNRCISEGRFTDGAIPRVVAQFVDGPA